MTRPAFYRQVLDPGAVDHKARVRAWARHREALRAARSILATAAPDETTADRLAACDWLLDVTRFPSGKVEIVDPVAGEEWRAVGYRWAAALRGALSHGAVASMPARTRVIRARVEAVEWALRLTSPPDNDDGDVELDSDSCDG